MENCAFAVACATLAPSSLSRTWGHGLHLAFQIVEGIHERRERIARRLRIARGQIDQMLRHRHIGAERLFHAAKRFALNVCGDQTRFVFDAFAKGFGVLLNIRAHVIEFDCAIGVAGGERGENIGAQRVVHHVGRHVLDEQARILIGVG